MPKAKHSLTLAISAWARLFMRRAMDLYVPEGVPFGHVWFSTKQIGPLRSPNVYEIPQTQIRG
jgi:hypothetical protein